MNPFEGGGGRVYQRQCFRARRWETQIDGSTLDHNTSRAKRAHTVEQLVERAGVFPRVPQ